MKTELIPGRMYSIKRITGKVVEFVLVEYNPEKRSLTMSFPTGQGSFEDLTDKELDSIVEIEPFNKQP